MKIRNIFMSLLAVLFVATGCVEEKIAQLDELQVSQSIIGFDAENPEAVEVIFNATADWAIATADGKELPAWFTVEPLQGTAGETTVVFKAAGADKVAHEADLIVNVFDEDKNIVAVQQLLVKQGVQSKEITPLNDIFTAGVEGATYYVHAKIAEITNSKYGNLVLQDKSGTLNVYGTLNDDGEEGHFTDLGLAVGDEIWAHGPFKPYKGTPQLKNITVDKFKKSLIALEDGMDKFEIAKEGKEIEVLLKVAGQSVDIDPGCDWISVSGINISGGHGVLKLNVAANTDVKPRTAKVKITSGDSAVVTEITQLGNVPDMITIADAMKESYVHVNGTVLATCTKGYVIADDTDAIFVYFGNKERPYDNSKKVGDKVDVVGARGVYNYAPQINDPQVDDVIGTADVPSVDPVAYDPAKMDALVATLDGKDKTKDILVDIQYVKLTGKLSYGEKYKNLIVSGTNCQGSLYGVDDAMGLSKFDGQNIDLFGYLVQISGGKFFNVVVTNAAPAEAVTPEPEPEPEPEPSVSEATLDFGAHADFASWETSYVAHEMIFDNATVSFEKANKQSGTITDCPVTKGYSVIIKMKGDLKMKTVDFTFKQWTDKAQTATLHTSTNGVDFTETAITSDTFALSSGNLPEGTVAVKVTFSSQKNQIGIQSAKITW